MFKKVLLFILFSISVYPVYAQTDQKDIKSFCSTLVDKDMSSMHTRRVLKQFFYTDDDLSNFIVYINVQIKHTGFSSSVIYGCSVQEVTETGSTLKAVLDITGRGAFFFLRKHVLVTTHWISNDNRWYLQASPVIEINE